MITIVQGSIIQCNEEYVIQQCDCISTKCTKLDMNYVEEFPWADVYGQRKQMNGYRNMASYDSRGKPGTIKIFDNGSKNDPKVVAFFTQICPGKPFTGINSK